MLPIPLLIALFLAFGVETTPTPPDDPHGVLLLTFGAVLAVGSAAFLLGLGTASLVRRRGHADRRIRRAFVRGSRVLTLFTLAAFGWLIHFEEWPGLVLRTWGWRGSILVDDVLILAPFLLMQLLAWWGGFYGERAIQGVPAGHPSGRVLRHLYLLERQSLGLTLPVLLVFILRNDVLGRLRPDWQLDPIAETVEVAVLGLLVLTVAPLFLRMAWPTRSLPDGPLRDRLEGVARRSGFRCTDILVWDTDRTMLNACVAGVLPGLRYVLLSDALIEALTEREIAAIFGHEIGHVAHRHLQYFLFFFVGSLAFLTMSSEVFAGLERHVATLTSGDLAKPSMMRDVAEGAVVLATIGGLFGVVFGRLSRRFERQADVYGCKVVSCGSAECPPHFEVEGEDDGRSGLPSEVCPAGVRIFAEALANVARLNGIAAEKRLWRHGSVASRIAFLRQLGEAPGREAAFQRQVRNARYGLGAALVGSVGLASAMHWLGLWR